MNPRLEVRPPRPKHWPSARPIGVGTEWHHIIPYALLRDVWNRLVDRHIATELAEARLAIRQYSRLCSPRQADLESLLDRMRAENTTKKRAAHSPLRPLEYAEQERLASAAAWPPWGVVEGPDNRSDDPKDLHPNQNVLDRFTAGLRPEEVVRMKIIDTLFRQFEEFVSAGPAPGPANLRMLAQAASIARPGVSCDLPISYRAEMWEKEPTGKWRKKR